jgi:hypothetical protein
MANSAFAALSAASAGSLAKYLTHALSRACLGRLNTKYRNRHVAFPYKSFPPRFVSQPECTTVVDVDGAPDARRAVASLCAVDIFLCSPRDRRDRAARSRAAVCRLDAERARR